MMAVLAVPLIAASDMFAMILGYALADVPWIGWVSPVLGTVMFVWGGSPFLTGAAQYRDRVRRLVVDGRVMHAPGLPVDGDPTSGVLFKADIGLLSSRCAQIQGVWLHPGHRGRGLAVPAMAEAVRLIERRAPRVSLYVNAFNTPALRTYARVGFEQRGTFATVLY